MATRRCAVGPAQIRLADSYLENASEGEKSTAFTWRIKVNGNEAADGVSFYDTNAEGKVDFIRDIPSPLITPAPVQALAALMRPKLRVFEPL